jgi:hypothetical protein
MGMEASSSPSAGGYGGRAGGAIHQGFHVSPSVEGGSALQDRAVQRRDLAATVTPGWAPGAAHVTGKRFEEKGAEEAKAGEAKLEQLAKEVDGKGRS